MIRALGAAKRMQDASAVEETSRRTCVVTRAERAPEELIRFAAAPDGQIVPDIARKLPGRGVWVTCHRPVLEAAVARGAFARSLKRKVTLDDELVTRVDTLLHQRALQLLSLCNKAGLVVAGSSKVTSWMDAGANGALVQASDASPDGLEKVARKYRAVRAATGKTPIEVSLLTISDLSLAIGRANVVHAGVSAGKATTQFLAAVRRVMTFRAAEFEAPASMVAPDAHDEQRHAIRNTGQV